MADKVDPSVLANALKRPKKRHPVADVLGIIFACMIIAAVVNSWAPGTGSMVFAILTPVMIALYFISPAEPKK